VLGYSSRAEVVSELAEAKAAQGALLEKIAATPVEEIASDPELLRFAIAGGSSRSRSIARSATVRVLPDRPAIPTSTMMTGSGAEPSTRST
jgi:hypothetical protein